MTKPILDFPWEDRRFYINFLSQTYHYVRHSTRLLASAASDCGFKEPMATWHDRFCRHLSQELGHEKLALKDLQRLGVTPGEEYEITRLFYTPYYYHGPVELMGYILALEETAAAYGHELYMRCADAHGVTACTFLRVHAKDDPEHVSEAHKLVEMLTPYQQRLVEECRDEALENYFLVLAECEKDR